MSRKRSPLVQRLLASADVLLRTRKDGCTTADLIKYARETGILTGRETGKELSALGHVFREAGGENSGTTRNSHLEGQNGVAQVVWVRSPYRRK